MKSITQYILMLMVLLMPLSAHATQYVIDGLRYDCTGSGSSARAALMPAGSSDTPYTGDIVVPGQVTVASMGRSYNVVELKSNAFSNTTVTSVVLPAGMNNLGQAAFDGCAQLTSVTLPTAASSLPMNFFRNCTSLQSMVIPDNFINMQGAVFEGCTALTDVTLPGKCYLLGGSFFKGCTSLESVVVPDSYTLLGVNAFEGCTSLTSVTLPAATSSLPDGFFKGCTALAEFTLSEKIKTLNKSCLEGSGLSNIVFPSAVSSIKVDAFTNCASLAWVEFQGTTVPDVAVGAFDTRFLNEGIVYVPDSLVDTYKAVSGIADAVNIKPLSEKSSGGEEEWISLGTATFTDPWICSVFKVERLSWSVEVEECVARPGYLRIINPYLNGNCPTFAAGQGKDIYINACDSDGVYIPTQGLGFSPNYSAGNEFFISSVAGRHQENNVQSLEADKAEGLTGFYSEGTIRIPAQGLLWSLPPYTDEDYYWCKYDFELRLPGAKIYDISAEVMCLDEYYINLWQECVSPGEVVPVKLRCSEGASNVKYGVFPGVITPSTQQITLVANDGKPAIEGRNDIVAIDDYVGRRTAVFVALDEAGHVRSTSKVVYDIINETVYGPWKSLGKTLFEDVVMLINYDAYVAPYAVEVEESESRPGIFRLKNVYSTRGHWTSSEGNLHHHDDQNHYLYINAEDPNAVYVMPSPVGLKTNDGSMLISSQVASYLDNGFPLEETKVLLADKLGTYVNNVITIPDGAMLCSETRYNDGAYYVGNAGMNMTVRVPDNTTMLDAISTESDVRYFNLQGIELGNPAPGTPVIKVEGKHASKAIYR